MSRTKCLWARMPRAATVVLAGAVLLSCGGGSTEAVPPGDVEVPKPGLDGPVGPVWHHLGAEMDGRTRRGVNVPANYAFSKPRRGAYAVRFNPCEAGALWGGRAV